jgi:putative transposase
MAKNADFQLAIDTSGCTQGWSGSLVRPRVRTIDGHEVPLEIYALAKDDNELLETGMELMLHGLSNRNY